MMVSHLTLCCVVLVEDDDGGSFCVCRLFDSSL